MNLERHQKLFYTNINVTLKMTALQQVILYSMTYTHMFVKSKGRMHQR